MVPLELKAVKNVCMVDSVETVTSTTSAPIESS